MNSLTFIPNGYSSTNSSYLDISSITNAYTNTASTTYATVKITTGRGASNYISLTFDTSSIPENAIIETISCSAKIAFSSTNTGRTASRSIQLYNGSTAMGSSVSFTASSTASPSTPSITATSAGTWDRDSLNNIQLRITTIRGTSTSALNMYVYGAELVVSYSEPVKYLVTTTVENGVLLSPESSVEVSGGDSLEISFSGNSNTIFNEMTVNGLGVIPSHINGQSSAAATWQVSTNYGTYSTYTLSNINDGNESTYWWSSEAQSVGKYVLITFNKFVNLNSFQTYSSNSTDYPHSCNLLQVSSDGNLWKTVGTFSDAQTSTFSNLNEEHIKYVRIYIEENGVSNWLVINEITMSYETPEILDKYSYTLSNITEDKEIIIVFKEKNKILFKINGQWRECTAYKKTDGVWNSISLKNLSEYLKDKKIKIN